MIAGPAASAGGEGTLTPGMLPTTGSAMADDLKDQLLPAARVIAIAEGKPKAEERALVPIRPMIARRLDEAAKGQLVYVGRAGEVKDPEGVRNRQLAAYVVFGGIMAVGVSLAASSLPLLIPFY